MLPTECRVNTYYLVTKNAAGVYSNYTGSEWRLDSATGYVMANSATSFIKTVYVEAMNSFGFTRYSGHDVKVCGLERVQLTNNNVTGLSFNYSTKTEGSNKEIVRFGTYSTLLASTDD